MCKCLGDYLTTSKKARLILILRILALIMSLFGFYCVIVFSLIISEEYPNEVFWVSLIGFIIFGSIYLVIDYKKIKSFLCFFSSPKKKHGNKMFPKGKDIDLRIVK